VGVWLGVGLTDGVAAVVDDVTRVMTQRTASTRATTTSSASRRRSQ